MRTLHKFCKHGFNVSDLTLSNLSTVIISLKNNEITGWVIDSQVCSSKQTEQSLENLWIIFSCFNGPLQPLTEKSINIWIRYQPEVFGCNFWMVGQSNWKYIWIPMEKVKWLVNKGKVSSNRGYWFFWDVPGARYPWVPMTSVTTSTSRSATRRASPKSATRALNLSSRRMLAGFTSRWMIWWEVSSCKYSNPLATSFRITHLITIYTVKNRSIGHVWLSSCPLQLNFHVIFQQVSTKHTMTCGTVFWLVMMHYWSWQWGLNPGP